MFSEENFSVFCSLETFYACGNDRTSNKKIMWKRFFSFRCWTCCVYVKLNERHVKRLMVKSEKIAFSSASVIFIWYKSGSDKNQPQFASKNKTCKHEIHMRMFMNEAPISLFCEHVFLLRNTNSSHYNNFVQFSLWYPAVNYVNLNLRITHLTRI